MKFLFTLFAMLFAFLGQAFAAATDFTSSLPTSLLPDGFWPLVALVFGVLVTIGGVIIGMKLIKRARG